MTHNAKQITYVLSGTVLLANANISIVVIHGERMEDTHLALTGVKKSLT